MLIEPIGMIDLFFFAKIESCAFEPLSNFLSIFGNDTDFLLSIIDLNYRIELLLSLLSSPTTKYDKFLTCIDPMMTVLVIYDIAMVLRGVRDVHIFIAIYVSE